MTLPKDEYSVFLKVTPKDKNHPLNKLERILINYSIGLQDAAFIREPSKKKKQGIFGVLARVSISGVTSIDYELIGMVPFCVETGEPKNKTLYNTVDDSIQAATQFFDKEGYVAKQVALKDFLDSA